MLFGKKKGIFAPVAGTFVPITEVNDPVFAQKMMGDGVAVIPETDEIVSPVVGTVKTIIEQKHALGIETANGQEILIHMGLDTVELAGEPFEILVQVGDKVDVGTPLAHMDRKMVEAKGKDTVVLVIVTGQELASQKYSTQTPVSAGAELAKM
jgi:PTS system, glucose subfamily, IIA component